MTTLFVFGLILLGFLVCFVGWLFFEANTPARSMPPTNSDDPWLSREAIEAPLRAVGVDDAERLARTAARRVRNLRPWLPRWMTLPWAARLRLLRLGPWPDTDGAGLELAGGARACDTLVLMVEDAPAVQLRLTGSGWDVSTPKKSATVTHVAPWPLSRVAFILALAATACALGGTLLVWGTGLAPLNRVPANGAGAAIGAGLPWLVSIFVGGRRYQRRATRIVVSHGIAGGPILAAVACMHPTVAGATLLPATGVTLLISAAVAFGVAVQLDLIERRCNPLGDTA